LRFRGGLTSARGHRGDSAGQRAILGMISGDPAASPAETPVFGCSIVDPPSSGGPVTR
jgi:hypothetical protein